MQQHSEMGSQPKKMLEKNVSTRDIFIQKKVIYKVIIHHTIYLFSITTKRGGIE